ncbi:FAD-dependent monooxygenase [Streptomyces celluloflavus]|uniref:FAD-dependent monooxygenase n=1 Tax=Streptomyces celluloflavus TaxID=58344 RepID=A0ABW7RLU1_9ACTN
MSGRLFLAGEAAHIQLPAGGTGGSTWAYRTRDGQSRPPQGVR